MLPWRPFVPPGTPPLTAQDLRAHPASLPAAAAPWIWAHLRLKPHLGRLLRVAVPAQDPECVDARVVDRSRRPDDGPGPGLHEQVVLGVLHAIADLKRNGWVRPPTAAPRPRCGALSRCHRRSPSPRAPAPPAAESCGAPHTLTSFEETKRGNEVKYIIGSLKEKKNGEVWGPSFYSPSGPPTHTLCVLVWHLHHMEHAAPTLYLDYMSQPSRACAVFIK
jgi:hypothetical protein